MLQLVARGSRAVAFVITCAFLRNYLVTWSERGILVCHSICVQSWRCCFPTLCDCVILTPVRVALQCYRGTLLLPVRAYERVSV